MRDRDVADTCQESTDLQAGSRSELMAVGGADLTVTTGMTLLYDYRISCSVQEIVYAR